MNKKDKKDILTFAACGFREFYANNHVFLSDKKYKPGKKTYRNLLSLNKFMNCYLHFGEDYIVKKEVIDFTGWDGSSSYVQHERIITNFELSDTNWQNSDRAVLLLSDAGKKLRDQYSVFLKENPGVDLSTMDTLPDFAIKYIIKQIETTTSQNMTLWKNTIITALFMYCVLGYIPHYSNKKSPVKTNEKMAFKDCLNYVSNGELQDITYTVQPIAMLKNLKLLSSDEKLTESGYTLLRKMKIFSETEISYAEYKDSFGHQFDEASEILSKNVTITLVDAPERKKREIIVSKQKKTQRPTNRDFAKEDEKSIKIGKLGESLALDYERKRLIELGMTDVEEKVFLTADNPLYGNAYPCDIISFDPDSKKKIYIEVKTTQYKAETPFYISKEEVSFSETNKDDYVLYRIYNVMSKTIKPSFYKVEGSVKDNFTLISDRFLAVRDIIEEKSDE